MMTLVRTYFWRAVFAVLMLAGAYSTFVRFYYGLGASTNLSDQFPWGIWIGFDVLCGVGLAAGGFTLAAIVHIFNIKSFHPVVRPAILTAFLGYMLVVVALMFDLGRPYRIWHPIIMWNPRSVMFEVGWCVTLYTTVLALEFSPLVFEKLRLERPLRIIHGIQIPLVIAGVLLSTLHQSSLGSLYLIVPGKLHPLWYTQSMAQPIENEGYCNTHDDWIAVNSTRKGILEFERAGDQAVAASAATLTISKPRRRKRRLVSIRSSNSETQGPHQVAQKFTSRSLPVPALARRALSAATATQ